MLGQILTISKLMEQQPSETFGEKKIQLKTHKRGLYRRVVFHIRRHSIINQQDSLILCVLIAELNFIPFKMNMRPNLKHHFVLT